MQLCKTSTYQTAASLKLQALRKTWSQKAKMSSNVFGHKEAVFKYPARKQQRGKSMVNFGQWWLSSRQPACHRRRLGRPRLSPSLPLEYPRAPVKPSAARAEPALRAEGWNGSSASVRPRAPQLQGERARAHQDPARPYTQTKSRYIALFGGCKMLSVDSLEVSENSYF